MAYRPIQNDEPQFSYEQLKVSSFEPHHNTTIFYPDMDLLRDPDTEFLHLPALKYKYTTPLRYEPHPLVRDTAVVSHADRENEAEVSFFTRKKIEHVQLPLGPAPVHPKYAVFAQLVADMRYVERFLGTTTLSMLTYEIDDPDDASRTVELVRVRRLTVFRGYGGQLNTDTTEYQFERESMYSDGVPDNLNEPWFATLI